MEYRTEIKETSKQFTAKERIQLKDTTNAVKIDEATKDGKLIINPEAYVILSIHNEKSDNVDYEVFVILDKNGTKYVTGSQSFFTSFKEIWDEMEGENEEWAIEAYKVDSKNYKGKQFITCSIV